MADKNGSVKVTSVETWEVPEPLKVENKDPRYAYRFLSERVVKQRGLRGWEIIKDDSPEQVSTGVISADNTKRVGELILARMPIEKRDQRNEYYRERAERMRQGNTNQLRRDMTKRNVSPASDIKGRTLEIRRRRGDVEEVE